MILKLLWFVPAIMLLGCGRSEKVPAKAERPTAEATHQLEPVVTPPTELAVVTHEVKPAEPAPEEKTPTDQWPPGFELPLVIHIDAPEPPPEIVGPSPPIKETKKADEKKADEMKSDEKNGTDQKSEENTPC
jgi:hypothetical protein